MSARPCPLFRPHVREQQNITDGGRVRQQHDQPVDPDPLACRGRHAVFECADVVGVIVHRLVVSRLLLLDLLPETLGLVLGIIELREAVGNLASADKEFEPVRNERISIVAPRQRRDFGRVSRDKGRIHEPVLDALLEDLDLDLAQPVGVLECNAEALCNGTRLRKVVDFRFRDIGIEVQDRLPDCHTRETAAEVIALPLILNGAAAVDVKRQASQHVFCEIHEVVVIRIGLVELQHRELGIMPCRETLVAEVAIDFINALEAADHEPLQIEFGRNAQEEIHVEGIVIGRERARRSTSRDHLHHRRFDFHEAVTVEIVANELDDARADAEGFTRRLVHDQVEVAHAVTLLLVCQAVKLLRQRAQRLGQ